MNWWNRNVRTRISSEILIWVFYLVVILGGIFLLLKPILFNEFCTMADCVGDGVRIILVGQKPENYTIEVKFPSGKRSLTCTPESIPSDNWQDWGDFNEFGDSCWSYGAFFEQLDSQGVRDKPPQKIVVTVMFDGKKITKTFYPEYQIDYPNGEGCDPMCYYTTIEFDLSQ